MSGAGMSGTDDSTGAAAAPCGDDRQCARCERVMLYRFPCGACEEVYCRRHRRPTSHRCPVDPVALEKTRLKSVLGSPVASHNYAGGL